MSFVDSDAIAASEGRRLDPMIEDCACPKGVEECCGECPGGKDEPCCRVPDLTVEDVK